MVKTDIIYNEQQIDALREIGNIGAGHAAGVLSKTIGTTIFLDIPKVEIIQIGDLPKDLSVLKNSYVESVYFRLSGDIKAYSLIMFPPDNATVLINALLNREREAKVFFSGAMERSAFLEICNILIGSYLTAMNRMTNLTAVPSVPYFKSGTPVSIIDFITAKQSAISDMLLFIEIQFKGRTRTFNAWLCVIPEVKSVRKILDSINA